MIMIDWIGHLEHIDGTALRLCGHEGHSNIGPDGERGIRREDGKAFTADQTGVGIQSYLFVMPDGRHVDKPNGPVLVRNCPG